MLPVLVFLPFQTGFVKGCQAADGVFVANRAAEVSREWVLKVYAVQIDLKKAFDRVLHSAVLRSIALQGPSGHCVAVLAALLPGLDVDDFKGIAAALRESIARCIFP